ncbi:MAG: hypothetical protein ABIF18_01875 [archaeon]
MKKIIVIGILGIVLVSFVSAGLLDYFGKIEGSVEVSGPVFYLDGNKDLDYDNYYTLKLSDNNIASAYPLLSGDEKIWFVSDILGIDNFYDEEYDITLKLKSVNGDVNLTGSISAELWIGDEDNYRKEKICETPILIGISREEEPYDLKCVPGSEDGLKNIDDDEKIMLALTTDPSDIDIKLYISSPRIEVSAQ